MALNKLETVFSKGIRPHDSIPKDEMQFRPRVFRRQDLARALESAQTINQKGLSNILNYAHFSGNHVLVHLRHTKFKEDILLRAHPDPFIGRELICRWADGQLQALNLRNYEVSHIMVDDGRSMILAPIELDEIRGNTLKVRLPETGFAVGLRQARRYPCKDVKVELFQSGFFAKGELLDFSPAGLRVRVSSKPSHSFHWFNSDEVVNIHLGQGERILFSGTCRCVRQEGDYLDREIVLAPVIETINRFKRGRIRNFRQQLMPQPTVTFVHPFLKRKVQMEVYNISTSGFSVCESADEGVLMQGMIIPELTIDFVGVNETKCMAQVIHRSEENKESIRCGFAILDMDISSYSRLSHILSKALDGNAYISDEVDMDALWEFFFESSFIYPTKYGLIQPHKESLKETYRRVYQERPEIARHLTYQRNGRIYGHISMVRAYERTWMIHHYAAKAIDNRRAGFILLKRLMHYLNEMYCLPSAKMDYVMCYFRPQNKFPDRIFGGFARALNNPQGCSMDLFKYVPYSSLSLSKDLPKGWLLKPSSAQDLWEMNRFYSHYSNGLLLDALGLGPEHSGNESLEEVYSRLGFLRRLKVYSLSYRGRLNAVLFVDQSDMGFNLSELLNSIKIMVINPEGLPWNILSIAIGQLTSAYHMGRVPILLYPFHYAEASDVPYQRQYQVWVLNVRFGDDYLHYMQQKFKMSYQQRSAGLRDAHL
ncbi:MAG: PilZ domain-containing protein [Desulfobacteraceae bacterium]